MAFLIKIALVSLLATSSFTLPSPISDDETLMARTICSTNINANVWPFTPLQIVISKQIFRHTVRRPWLRDSAPGPTSPECIASAAPKQAASHRQPEPCAPPYKELDWNNGFRLVEGASISKSPPNAAVFDGVTQALNEARISIFDTVHSFTLKSLYLAGFLQSQGAALVYVPFTLTATGTKTNGQTVRTSTTLLKVWSSSSCPSTSTIWKAWSSEVTFWRTFWRRWWLIMWSIQSTSVER